MSAAIAPDRAARVVLEAEQEAAWAAHDAAYAAWQRARTLHLEAEATAAAVWALWRSTPDVPGVGRAWRVLCKAERRCDRRRDARDAARELQAATYADAYGIVR